LHRSKKYFGTLLANAVTVVQQRFQIFVSRQRTSRAFTATTQGRITHCYTKIAGLAKCKMKCDDDRRWVQSDELTSLLMRVEPLIYQRINNQLL